MWTPHVGFSLQFVTSCLFFLGGGPFSVFSTTDFKGKMTYTKGKTLYNLNNSSNNNKTRLWKFSEIIQVLSDHGGGRGVVGFGGLGCIPGPLI